MELEVEIIGGLIQREGEEGRRRRGRMGEGEGVAVAWWVADLLHVERGDEGKGRAEAMVIPILLSHHHSYCPFQHPAKPTKNHAFPTGVKSLESADSHVCHHPTKRTFSKEYKVYWIEKLKRAYPSKLNWEADTVELDDDSFQDMVDKRCVDNMRMLIVNSVQEAKAGHPGMAMGMAEVGYVLFGHFIRQNPSNPKWVNRDRFVLSAGHDCLLQYVCLHLAGFHSVQTALHTLATDPCFGTTTLDLSVLDPIIFGFTSVNHIEDLQRLCKIGSRTPGHPKNVVTDGVEAATGPLGQGVANAVGLALAEAHFGCKIE
ncbi:hypothetical protein Ancab_001349 [Ancistrocladus abbreviatus]